MNDNLIRELFCGAYSRAATVQNAISGFRSAGIWPFNHHVFGDADFAPSSVTELDVPEMSTESSNSHTGSPAL